MFKEMNEYKDLLITSGNQAVKEIFGNDYEFELHNINYDIDYNNTKDKYEISLIIIDGAYGVTGEDKSWKKLRLTLFISEAFHPDNPQFIKGAFFGKFQALEEND